MQATIRADGPPSAQALSLQLDICRYAGQGRGSTIARSARQPRFPYG